MIASLIRKLESELYNEGQGDAFEVQWRSGWNAGRRELLEWIKVEVGLHEMRASDVTEPMQIAERFDLTDLGEGEG